MQINLFKNFIVIVLFAFTVTISGAEEKSDNVDTSLVDLHLRLLQSIPVAYELCSRAINVDSGKGCDGGWVLELVSLAAQNRHESLDIPILELAEIYFGDSHNAHREAVIKRGPRMGAVIRNRMSANATQCGQYSRSEQLFINSNKSNYRCYLSKSLNASYSKSVRESLASSVSNKSERAVPLWPESMLQFGAEKGDIDEMLPILVRASLLQLPILQAAYNSSVGAVGWPAWFRIGVFIEVIARDPSPLVNIPLLELLDFSLGAVADASLQKALRLRMRSQPEMRALIQARLQQAPSWFLTPAAPDGTHSYDYGYFPETLKAMRQYGVVALTKQQRNIELRKLLRPDKP